MSLQYASQKRAGDHRAPSVNFSENQCASTLTPCAPVTTRTFVVEAVTGLIFGAKQFTQH